MARRQIGETIKKLRARRGWTQTQLAKRAKVHRVSLARLETALTRIPTLPTLDRIAQALGVSVAELLR